jgi:hypothetical protein
MMPARLDAVPLDAQGRLGPTGREQLTAKIEAMQQRLAEAERANMQPPVVRSVS